MLETAALLVCILYILNWEIKENDEMRLQGWDLSLQPNVLLSKINNFIRKERGVWEYSGKEEESGWSEDGPLTLYQRQGKGGGGLAGRTWGGSSSRCSRGGGRGGGGGRSTGDWAL